MGDDARERDQERHVRLDAVVGGRVQGVGYRAYVYERGRDLGLRIDAARNMPDGRTVEVSAVGPYAALNMLVKHLWIGSPAAEVTSVYTSWLAGD